MKTMAQTIYLAILSFLTYGTDLFTDFFRPIFSDIVEIKQPT